MLAVKAAQRHALAKKQAAGLAAGAILLARLLDWTVFTGGFLAHGMWHAHGAMLFESTTPLGAFPKFRSGVIIYESMRPVPVADKLLVKAAHIGKFVNFYFLHESPPHRHSVLRKRHFGDSRRAYFRVLPADSNLPLSVKDLAKDAARKKQITFR